MGPASASAAALARPCPTRTWHRLPAAARQRLPGQRGAEVCGEQLRDAPVFLALDLQPLRQLTT